MALTHFIDMKSTASSSLVVKPSGHNKWPYMVAEPIAILLPEYMHKMRVSHEFFFIDTMPSYGPPRMCIRAGYSWNGSSGPVVNDQYTLAASLAHDVFYQCVNEGLIADSDHRSQYDSFYYETAVAVGMNKLRAQIHLLGLMLFGWLYCKKKN